MPARAIAASLLALLSAAAYGQGLLDNATIAKLVREGIAEQRIVSMVNQQLLDERCTLDIDARVLPARRTPAFATWTAQFRGLPLPTVAGTRAERPPPTEDRMAARP